MVKTRTCELYTPKLEKKGISLDMAALRNRRRLTVGIVHVQCIDVVLHILRLKGA
jgi:hypothetical protein